VSSFGRHLARADFLRSGIGEWNNDDFLLLHKAVQCRAMIDCWSGHYCLLLWNTIVGRYIALVTQKQGREMFLRYSGLGVCMLQKQKNISGKKSL